MNALHIDNLPLSLELDKAAMSAILGGGRVAYEYLGSSVGSLSSWQYTGVRSSSYLGTVYLSGKGWTRKYRTSYQYKRQQYKYDYFNEFWQ
jgi:hypothetical protein